MSRHMMVCRDILKQWEDKLSSSCDIRCFVSLSGCRDLTNLLKELFISRPNHSVATEISVATKPLVATIALFFLQYLLSHDNNFCCDFNVCRDTSFCRDLVCNCLKFNEHTAFNSLSIRKFSASIKSFTHSNSNIHSIEFS